MKTSHIVIGVVVLAAAAVAFVYWRKSAAPGTIPQTGAAPAGGGAQAQALGKTPTAAQAGTVTYTSQQASAGISPGSTLATIGNTAFVNQGLGLAGSIGDYFDSGSDGASTGFDSSSSDDSDFFN